MSEFDQKSSINMMYCRVCLAAGNRVKLTLLNLTAFYNICNINVGSSKSAFACQYCWKRITQCLELIGTAQRTEYFLRNNAIGVLDMVTEIHSYKKVTLSNITTCLKSECPMHTYDCISVGQINDKCNTLNISIDCNNQHKYSDQQPANNVFINEDIENNTQQCNKMELIDIKHEFVYEDVEVAINEANMVEVPCDFIKQEIGGLNIELKPQLLAPLTTEDASFSKHDTIKKSMSDLDETETNNIKIKQQDTIGKQIQEEQDNQTNKQLRIMNKNFESKIVFMPPTLSDQILTLGNTYKDSAVLEKATSVVPNRVLPLSNAKKVESFIVVTNPVYISEQTAKIVGNAVNCEIATTSSVHKITPFDIDDREQMDSDIASDGNLCKSEEEKEKSLAGKKEMITLSCEQAKEEIEMMKRNHRYINSKYKCDKCGKGFQCQDVYAKHIDSYHNQDNNFECDICYYRFDTNKTLDMHYSLYHIDKWRCLQCKTIIRRNCWRSHKLMCLVQSLVCVLCQKTLKNKRTFEAHMKHIHKEKQHKCEVCDKTFTSAFFLSSHKRIHTGEKPYECLHCKETFICTNQLRRHVQTVHEIKPKHERYCSQCDKYFSTVKLLECHLKYSRLHANPDIFRYECHDCGARRISKGKLLDHIMLRHLERKEYKCTQCKKRYHSSKMLRQHVRLSHQPKQRNHTCTTCGQAFLTAKYLKQHMAAVHSMQRSFVCDVCGATFGFDSALFIHKKLKHEGAKRSNGRFYYPNRKDSVSPKKL